MCETRVDVNRVRRRAARQRLVVAKSRRRDPRAYDFGEFRLLDGDVVLVRGSLDAVEVYLTGSGEAAHHG